MVANVPRLVAYGDEAISKLKDMEIVPVAEIAEDIADIERVMLLKSVLENPDKKSINFGDKLKSKMANIGARIKGKMK